MSRKNRYISLKEAAEISGYAPDYVGQLIRQGRLPGKQIFSHVAWVTTEEAIRDYVNGAGGRKEKKRLWNKKTGGSFVPEKAINTLYYFVIGFLVLFLLFLFYAFSTSYEKSLDKKALQKNENAANQQ